MPPTIHIPARIVRLYLLALFATGALLTLTTVVLALSTAAPDPALSVFAALIGVIAMDRGWRGLRRGARPCTGQEEES